MARKKKPRTGPGASRVADGPGGNRSSILLIVALLTVILLMSQGENLAISNGGKLLYDEGENNNQNTNGDDFSLARTQSFGFFDDMTSKHWKLLQKIVAEHSNHKFMDQPLTHHPSWDKRVMRYFKSFPAWWQTNYEPNFSCQFERRIGYPNGNGDGPKWICDPHRIIRMAKERKAKDPNHPGCVIYSIGSNGDFSFEVGMQNVLGAGTCEIHIFDMGDYGKKVPTELERTHYHQWGLAKQNEGGGDPQPGQRFYGLKDTIKLLGHENLDTIDIFKIDCEKCEWSTFTDWVEPGIPSLQQIQVELHGAPGDSVFKFFDLLEQAGYVRYHKEPNIQFNDGSCQEYGLLKLDKEFFAERNERLKKEKKQKATQV